MNTDNNSSILELPVRCFLQNRGGARNEPEVSVILYLLIICDESLNVALLSLDNGDVRFDSVADAVDTSVHLYTIFIISEDFLESERHRHLGVSY